MNCSQVQREQICTHSRCCACRAHLTRSSACSANGRDPARQRIRAAQQDLRRGHNVETPSRARSSRVCRTCRSACRRIRPDPGLHFDYAGDREPLDWMRGTSSGPHTSVNLLKKHHVPPGGWERSSLAAAAGRGHSCEMPRSGVAAPAARATHGGETAGSQVSTQLCMAWRRGGGAQAAGFLPWPAKDAAQAAIVKVPSSRRWLCDHAGGGEKLARSNGTPKASHTSVRRLVRLPIPPGGLRRSSLAATAPLGSGVRARNVPVGTRPHGDLRHSKRRHSQGPRVSI